MAEIALPVRVPETEIDSPELNATVKQQVADILEEAVPEPQAQQSPPERWGYTVPCAGVRYYSY